jgi:hypothetical protein
MAKQHISFRLSDEAIGIIDIHAADLAQAKRKNIDRTDSLEDIILRFDQGQKTVLSRVRKKLSSNPFTIPLDTYVEGSKELEKEQLQEALR